MRTNGDQFSARMGVATVVTDKETFFDQILNAPFQSDAFEKVREIVKVAGFVFRKEYFFAGRTYRNVWVYESESALPAFVVRAVVEAAAVCGVGENEVAMDIETRRLSAEQGFNKISKQSSPQQIAQANNLKEIVNSL